MISPKFHYLKRKGLVDHIKKVMEENKYEKIDVIAEKVALSLEKSKK